MTPITACCRSIGRHLRSVLRKEDGTLTLEFLILAPLMVWTFLATLAYFDAYRTQAVTQKAAMTISDMISREDGYVTDTYLDGAYGLLTFLNPHDKAPQMRVSILMYHDSLAGDDPNDHFHVVWSKVRGMPSSSARTVLTGKITGAQMDTLPKMGSDDRLVLVETWSKFDSPYNLGLRTVFSAGATSSGPSTELKDIEMSSYIFSAPRVARVCFNNTVTDATQALC